MSHENLNIIFELFCCQSSEPQIMDMEFRGDVYLDETRTCPKISGCKTHQEKLQKL